MESRAGFMALKEQQKLEKELTGYVEWICRAEDLVLAEERTTEADKELIMEGETDAKFNNIFIVTISMTSSTFIITIFIDTFPSHMNF